MDFSSIDPNGRHVIVIGNGFDLSLGLKTSYNDFLESSYFQEEVLRDNKFAQTIKANHVEGNWIDIERDLKLVSKTFNTPIENDFENLCAALMAYVKTIDYDAMDMQSPAVKLLTKLRRSDFTILDYNYTEATERVLAHLEIPETEIRRRLIKVHGSVNTGDIIFGVEDHADIQPQHIFLKKSFNESFKGVSLSKMMTDFSQLHIFGHSLGETDHSYFMDFFQYKVNGVNAPTNITLAYYGKKGYHGLMSQLDVLTRNNITKFKQHNNFTTINCEP